MVVDAIRALHVVDGLGAGVTVTGVADRPGGPLAVGIELAVRPCCGGKVHRHGISGPFAFCWDEGGLRVRL